jgi:hypothetical protein
LVATPAGGFRATALAQQQCKAALTAFSDFPVFCQREDVALQDMTLLELTLQLHKERWVDSEYQSKAAPITNGRDSPTLYYKARDGSFKRSYLLALLSRNVIFGKGITSIYHNQLCSYYECLLEISPAQAHLVEPGMSQKSYKRLLGQCDAQEQSSGHRAPMLQEDSRLLRLFPGALEHYAQSPTFDITNTCRNGVGTVPHWWRWCGSPTAAWGTKKERRYQTETNKQTKKPLQAAPAAASTSASSREDLPPVLEEIKIHKQIQANEQKNDQTTKQTSAGSSRCGLNFSIFTGT